MEISNSEFIPPYYGGKLCYYLVRKSLKKQDVRAAFEKYYFEKYGVEYQWKYNKIDIGDFNLDEM